MSTETTDPWESDYAGITVSIKPSGGYDAALLIFKGRTAAVVQTQLRDWFGFEANDEQSPFETFVEADAQAKGVYALNGLGATPAPKKEYGKPANQQAAIDRKNSGFPASGAAAAPAATEEPAHKYQLILDAINDATTRADINALYAKCAAGIEEGFSKEGFKELQDVAEAKTKSFK